jgi:DNA-directed RNA polymerase specialized sigma24 family protein
MHYTNSDMRNAIEEHIHSERDRKLLLRRLIDGICFEPLAEEFDLSVRQTKNIVYRERAKLFELLHKSCTIAD